MSITDKITHSIIVNQITLNNNEAIKHTNYYKRGLKNKLNLLLSELVTHEPEYDAFFEKEEEGCSKVYEVYDEYIKAVASVPIWYSQDVTRLIEAFKKDPKSIEGIVNKILR